MQKVWRVAALSAVGLLAVGLVAVGFAFSGATEATEATAATTAKGLAVEIIGHRGASYDAPENTLASVKRAWEQGADAVEIDVRLSRDGQIVLLHDDTLRRTAGLERKVVDLDLAEIRRLDAGRWKAEAFAGEPIPTLTEVLATVPEGKRLFIEVKCGKEVVPALQRELEQFPRRDQVVVIGFSRPTMEAVKRAMPQTKVCWIVRVRQHDQTGEWLPPLGSLIRRTKESGLDGLDLSSVPVIDREYVRQVKDAGLEFYVWTVNDADEARKLAASGVDGITTDRPGWLREQLQTAVQAAGE